MTADILEYSKPLTSRRQATDDFILIWSFPECPVKGHVGVTTLVTVSRPPPSSTGVLTWMQ